MSDWEAVEWEYHSLKSEQLARIGFRDNMVYLSLVAIGAVSSFAVTERSHHMALLVLPFLNVILGWMYVVNDQKISAIGAYIRTRLTQLMAESGGCNRELVLGWEVAHRDDRYRLQRKTIQCAIDLLTFVVPGIAALTAFLLLTWPTSLALVAVVVMETVMLGVLTWQILQYADVRRGR